MWGNTGYIIAMQKLKRSYNNIINKLLTKENLKDLSEDEITFLEKQGAKIPK